MQALHGAALRVGEAADVAGDLAGRHVLGGDDGVDAEVVHQRGVVRARHLRQDLGNAGVLRGERHEQILLVAPCEGDEGIRVEDALGFEQVMVRAVAVEDGRLRQLLGDRHALFLVLLNDGDVHPHAVERPGEVERDAPAADHAQLADGRGVAAHAAQHAGGLGRCADGVNAVAGLRDKVAVRHQHLAAALGRAQQQRVGMELVVFDQALAGHAVLLGDLEADELHGAAGEALHAERGGHAQDARDLLRGGVFGVDDHVQTDLAAQDRRVAEVFGVAHAGDRVLGAQLFRHQRADEVHLVIRRGCDDQVGIAHTGAQQHARARTVALDAHGVERGVGVLDHGGALVHQNQVVLLADHLLGNGVADLAQTDNDDLHALFSVLPRTARRVISPVSARLIRAQSSFPSERC